MESSIHSVDPLFPFGPLSGAIKTTTAREPVFRQVEYVQPEESASISTIRQAVDAQQSLRLIREVTAHADVRAGTYTFLSELAKLIRPDLVGSAFLLEPEIGKFRLYAAYRLNLLDSESYTLLPQEMFGREAYETLRPSVAHWDKIEPFISDEVRRHHYGKEPQEVITLPLVYDGRCFGIINLEHYDRKMPLSAVEIERAFEFCELISPVLRHSQLYDQCRTRELDMIQLNKVLHAVNSTLDIESILKTIRRSLGHNYRFDLLAVLLIDQQQHELRFEYVHGSRITPDQQERYRALRLSLASGDSVHVRAIATQQPIQLAEIPPGSRMAAFDRQSHDVAPFRSAIVFPLVYQQQPIGTIAFVNQIGRTDLAPGQVAYLQRFVSQVVTAIENFRQIEASRAAQRELQIKNLAIQSQSELISSQHKELYKKSEVLFEQSRELETLVKIMHVINSEMGLDRTMEALLEEGTLLIPAAQKGVFMSFDANERCFRPVAYRGYQASEMEQIRLSWREATERFMPAQRELIPNVYVVNKRNLAPNPQLDHLPQAESTLTLAVNVKGALQGFLLFDNFESQAAFGEADSAKVQRLLEHAASAFYKARFLQQIQEQKTQLQDAYLKISDSINYARRILEAILPRDRDMRAAMPEHFVLFKPRDVVSGDFYWFSAQPGRVVLAAVDCTGHGIPGAFMSVLGNTLLNQVVNEKGISDPGKVLKELDGRVKRMLGQLDSDSATLDGMDVGIWTLDTRTGLLQFGGANRSLLLFQNGELSEVKGARRPVGGLEHHSDAEFITHSCQLSVGDAIYLFTDGITDQFGGTPAKKFLTSRFKALVAQVAAQPMSDQREAIRRAHEKWRGRTAQMDDILVMGLRYTGSEGAQQGHT